MKATKKQIAEVTAAAIEMGADVNNALTTLSQCSLSIYKVIGAKGVVDASLKTKADSESAKAGGYRFNASDILSSSEKAYLISINTGVRVIEKWVAKSIIINGNTVPFWAVK